MSGWIKLDKDMVDDPRMMEAAMRIVAGNYVIADRSQGGGQTLEGPALRCFACNALLGALQTLWRYADEHIGDDDTLPISLDTLDAFVGLRGFSEHIPRQWVVETDDGRVKLPGYGKKNSLITKRKRAIKSNKRVAAWRAARNASGNAVGNAVGNAHYTERTPALHRGEDLDIDSKKKTLRSSSSGDLSPSSSVRGESDGLKNREEKKQKVQTLVAELADAKRWA
jgi:hypothetical protein